MPRLTRPNSALLLAIVIAAIVGSRVRAQTDVPTIVFGVKHAVALRTNGDVVTWGDNVFCELGRTTSTNRSATPEVVMRNVKEIAAASSHTLALTVDGKVYAWGGNDQGALGTGDENGLCEGPALVSSLANVTVEHIATGLGFSLAVTTAGDLLCTGDNEMGQCPPAPARPGGGRLLTFTPMANPELAGKVAAIRAGAFHALVLTRDGKLYAFGRGRDGQLGNGRTVNGLTLVPEMTDVVSFAAGTWHSVAARADGSVWTWGNNSRSQLCDGTTTNLVSPTKVTRLPAVAKITQVLAGGHDTVMRASDGTVYACGDNQFGSLGADRPAVIATPATIASATSAVGLATNGAASAYSTDGCAVRIAGYNDNAVVSAVEGGAMPFAPRANLSLCAPKPPAPLPTLLREPPRGGASGCWAPRQEEDAATNPKFAPLRQAMLAGEALLKQNAAWMTAPVPVRYRTSLSAGPYNESGARMHLKAVPERKMDATRLWTDACGIIPQLDRIGGAIAQISIFFNTGASGQFIGASGEAPKLTGRVGGYPEYNNWVLVTKDGRVPWIPVTLADKLDVEGARRKTALAEWLKNRANIKVQDPALMQQTYQMLKKTDPAGAESYLTSMKELAVETTRLQTEVYPATTAAFEKRVRDFEQYRAAFTPDQLRQPAVWGDPTGEGKKRLDAQIAALQALSPEEQKQPTRDVRQRHMEKVEPLIDDATAQYELTNLRPGSADKAMAVKPDPSFPDVTSPNRIQLISISFSMDPDPRQTDRRAWQQKVKDTFDFAALAALIK